MEDDEEEGYDWGPKYSVILQEEDYEEDDEGPQGYDKGPEENYDDQGVQTWDPWEPSYFFRIT
jgi:hypothetical protein